MSVFTGSGVAIITPFKEDKSIDFNAFEKLMEFHLKNGTDALVVCGTTGEASTLTEEEHIELVKFAVKNVSNKIPVIAGAGSNSTAHSLTLCKKCEEVGANSLLIITPYYNKTTQNGIIKHYEILAKNVSVPIIAYNVPSRTGLNIEPKTALELSKIENIVGIKEASGDISQVAEIAAICSKDFDIYSGNDNQVLPILSLGGKGVISVMANILPNETHNIVSQFLSGNFEESKRLQLKYMELINILFCEINPIPIKAALSLMGFIQHIFREPLFNMEEKNIIKLEEVMKKYEIIK